jgi:CHASE2 domain-containing sensor protein
MRAFWLDAVFGTIFVFLIMGFFKYTFDRVELLDPVADAIGDTEITDIVFSTLREEPLAEERIVLVNIGFLNREGIAAQLDIISQYNPAVIGIDAKFFGPKPGVQDSLLENSIKNAGNVIIPHVLMDYNDELGYFDSVAYAYEPFEKAAFDEAFVNLITPAGEQEQFKIVRSFTPREQLEGREALAFGVKLAEYIDQEKVDQFLARKKEFELINFKRNIIDWFEAGKFSGKFPTLDVDDIFNENFVPEMIEGKIVIMGYLGQDLFDTSWDDKFFTPLNVQYAGKTNPDMYGAVVHANIAAMVLNQEFIDHMSVNSGIILGIILCFLNVALFSLIYKRLDQWYDGLTKLIQLVEIFSIFGLVVWVFNSYDFKLDMTVSLVAIALAGDALEVYFGVIKNLFTVQGRRTLFRKKDTNDNLANGDNDIELGTQDNGTQVIESKELNN